MDVLAGDIEIHLPPDYEEYPHVQVLGSAEAVRLAGALVRQELEPHSKVTMKLDVSWTHHSHIIGKGGNTIQPVVKKTGVSIHFPDGNKSSELRKSNQVSINSRGEDLHGLEEAREAIRHLTPLIFSFTLSSSVQFVRVMDTDMLVLYVQSTYNVQVELRALEEQSPVIVGSVRGCEWEAQKVKEATLYILQAYCGTLASQVPIQMTVEVSPQHHSFVLGRNNDNIKRIMHRTSTKISFPDTNDMSLVPLKKSTVTISGAIDNVYLARQNIIGSLPLVLMFDLMPDNMMEMSEVAQLMQLLDVQIIMKTRRMDGRRPVIIKGAERNAGNIYEAWRLLCKVEKSPPKARIPATYQIPDISTVYGLNSDLGLGQWVGGSSGGSSPIPSPTSTPAPQVHPSSALWGGLPTSSSLFSHLSRPLQLDPASLTSNCYTTNLLRNGFLTYNNNNNNNDNDYCILPKHPGGSSSGNMNLHSLVSSMKGMTLTNGDASCGTSSNSGSSLSSPSDSPRYPSPDQMLGPQVTSTTTTTTSTQYTDEPMTSSGMNAISALLKDIDRRAPGCEKKHMEMAAQKLTLSDYSSKKVQAAKAMKQDVGSTPRTPTSSWSGYGFSKSMPGFMIRQKLQEAKGIKASQNGGLEDWDGWQQKQDSSSAMTDFSQTVTGLKYSGSIPQYGLSEDSLPSLQRPPINLSASNFMDCLLPRASDRDTTSSGLHSSQHLDVTSILTDLQLAQYIDVFLGQEVDLNMFLTLDDSDLKELGIKIFGHRKRILMAVKDLSRRRSSLFPSGATGRVDRSPSTIRETSTWD